VGSREGVFPSPVWEGLGRELCPLPRNFFDFFLSGNGAFWCILGACFNVSIRRVKQSRKAVLCANCQWSVISHGGRIIHDIMHINTYIRVSSQPVRHTCSLYYGHSRHSRYMLLSISIYYFHHHVFYFKRFNSISLKLLSADGMFIIMNTLVAYGP